MQGIKDKQTTFPNGEIPSTTCIEGVVYKKLNTVLTRSGILTEIFRSDWIKEIEMAQVNWVELNPNAVTDWHFHSIQTDHLIAVSGNIKLCLFDGRPKSTTSGISEIIRFGIKNPALVIVPPGVWHGLRNESGQPAGYLNVINELYNHKNPDNFRLPADSTEIPIAL